MKSMLKLGLSLAAVAAIVLSFVALNSEPADATQLCPPATCPEVLDGYTYIGPCEGGEVPGLPCLGWIYQKGGQRCHVAALGGA